MSLLRFLPLLFFPMLAARAEDPSIAQERALIFSDNFSGVAVDTSRWWIAKGEWVAGEGAVRGSELAGDRHAAVMRAEVPFTNASIRFCFKLDGCSGISVSINAEKGHHSRVNISTNGFYIQKDRDKKDPRSLSLLLAQCSGPIEPGVWHSMVIEYSGPHLFACLNRRLVAVGTLDSLATPKASFGFTISGQSASFDEVELFLTEPRYDQAARIAEYAQMQAGCDLGASANPRIAYTQAEALTRQRLMEEDDAFNALLSERIALEEELHKRWPKAYRKGEAGLETRKKLLAEDPEFKARNAAFARARRAETAYLLNAEPRLKALAEKAKQP